MASDSKTTNRPLQSLIADLRSEGRELCLEAAERLILLQRDLRSTTTMLRRLIKESHGG